jgi:hypothetical protein
MKAPNTYTCSWIVFLYCYSLVPNRHEFSPFTLSSLEGKVKGKGLVCGYSRDRHLKSFNPELKLAWLMSAKN